MRFTLSSSRTCTKQDALLSPRARPLVSPRHGLNKQVATRKTRVQAIQTPLAYPGLQVLPNRSDTEGLTGNDAIIAELHSQLEEIWHEYAAARRRNMSLLEENEQLQSCLRDLEASLCQERYYRSVAEEKLTILKDATENCNP